MYIYIHLFYFSARSTVKTVSPVFTDIRMNDHWKWLIYFIDSFENAINNSVFYKITLTKISV